MRKDIAFSVETGDIIIQESAVLEEVRFNWCDNPSGLSRYMYGEITLPNNLSESHLRKDGVKVAVPYTPVYKEFYIRFVKTNVNGQVEYLQNPSDGGVWFLCQHHVPHKGEENVFASELLAIGNEEYCAQLKTSTITFSGLPADFEVVTAERQNANLLLKCHKSNCYRYPLSGVGLDNWINSTIDNAVLGKILRDEFEADGVSVKEAAYNTDSNSLQIELSEHQQ